MDDRRARREAVIIEHMQSENVQQWDRTMATFSHARYELPDGTVFDGADEVVQYWIDGRTLVPDQRNELIELTHLDDGQVQIEFWLRGTPTATGEPFEVRLWAVFGFDEADLITGERVYVQPPNVSDRRSPGTRMCADSRGADHGDAR
jgi:ketosteroid isomerase-like protein